jgi:hypothetical protein
MASLPQQLRSIPISQVYQVLTGRKVRRSGDRKWRAAALWRGGDALSVAGDDADGVWMDFVTNEGGGVLDLVAAIRGGTRREAYQWLADWAGVPSPARVPDASARSRWLEEQRFVNEFLPRARRWRRGMAFLTEELLELLKAPLLQPVTGDLELGEIYRTERLLSRLRRLDGAELVREYFWWWETDQELARLLTHWSAQLEADQRAEVRKAVLYGPRTQA